MSNIWMRPDLHLPQPFDTIFFDIDGVLIYTLDSFHATDIATAEYVTGTLHGLDWGQREGKTLLTIHDVDLFKRAGGYNNDWDMCYLLASLATARLREWRGMALAERTIEEWAAISRAANLQGHGGRAWVDEVIPVSARIDYNVIGDIYHEYYWGAQELPRRLGRQAHYLPNWEGFVQHERLLYTPEFPRKIREAGIHHIGMITGRVGPEVDSALERMEAYSGERWWDVVVAADFYAKPDPRALRYAIHSVNARGGLYIGDTADDHDLVRNYRNGSTSDDPPILAAMLVHGQEIELYQQRGADLIVQSVETLLDLLPVGTQE